MSNFNRDREYERPPVIADWLQSFADDVLKGGNKSIQNLIQKKNDLDAVEAMVKTLRERVGLDLIVESELEENRKTASEKLPGGLADGKEDEEFCPKQIEKGLEVEKEHTPDKEIRKEIAKDHLVENDKYYDHLEKMEKEMDKDKKANFVIFLTCFADECEKVGNVKLAMKVDRLISKVAKEMKEDKEDKEDKEEAILDKCPKMCQVVDLIVGSRGGHIDTPALLDILGKEFKDLKLNEKDKKSIEDYIKKSKEEKTKKVKDDDISGIATIMVITDSEANEDVFGPRK
jgi:hypothetical protein